MTRVQSKNLFNFPLTGVVDEDLVASEAKMEDQPEVVKLVAQMKQLALEEDSDNEFVALFRAMSEGFYENNGKQSTLQEASEKTTVEEFMVPTTHDGNFNVPVKVYTPKKLDGGDKKAAYIYAHGGGVISATADHNQAWLQYLAVAYEVVVFNVDYRLAPETKCPNNVKDFYESIKYVSKNAASLGIDPSKIAIGGDSGGGYICLGAMVLLAQNGESSLVKLAMPGIPMVDDYCFSDPAAMTVEERGSTDFLDVFQTRKFWKLIAADFDVQKSNPLLFPGKASSELLEKFPPTIIIECEFDVFITEATRLATRLRRAGRLLEFVVIPGAKHGSYMMTDLACSKRWENATTTAIQEYLHK